MLIETQKSVFFHQTSWQMGNVLNVMKTSVKTLVNDITHVNLFIKVH